VDALAAKIKDFSRHAPKLSARDKVMNWRPIKDVPENTPVQVLYFDIIDNNETPLLAFALKRNGHWFGFRGHDNAWDKNDYTEIWNINFPVQWQPIAELPTASNNGFNLAQAKQVLDGFFNR
jgi:hypothetical protein